MRKAASRPSRHIHLLSPPETAIAGGLLLSPENTFRLLLTPVVNSGIIASGHQQRMAIQ